MYISKKDCAIVLPWQVVHLDVFSSQESVSLELDNNHETVDEEILLMVTSCKFLRDLTINAVVLIPTIQQIMELQRERKISMKTL